MAYMNGKKMSQNSTLLQSEDLHKYVLESSVYARESKFLKELRDVTANHPWYFMAAAPESSQLIGILLKLLNAKKTIEIGVYTGYSLLHTALTLPEDGKITAIDINRETYEIGLPIIKKAGVDHKINFIESPGMPILDDLLKDEKNEGSFDFAFVDADKSNYPNYHERLIKLVKVGGIIVYDNTLWGGTVACPEEEVPEEKKELRKYAMQFNNYIKADSRLDLSLVTTGDGITICMRIC